MAHIPPHLATRTLPGLTRLGQGKVRDSYDLPPFSGLGEIMGVEASDRISTFDFVLNAEVSQKGEVLTAMNYFWVSQVLQDLFEHDLIACGASVDAFLPAELRGNPDLQKRFTVVRKLTPPTEEDIVRLHLTGSGWEAYKKTGAVCGHKLPPGLSNGYRLPYPLYTPTTKAILGHDEHITADSVAERYGAQRERLAIQVACLIADYAEKRGIILADTKFEFSYHLGKMILADEKVTPDSSRFWDKKEWQAAQAKGKLPASQDKQFVRNWSIERGINKLTDPDNPEQIAHVQSLVVPDEILERTRRIYRYIFWRLTGMKLETFQREKMGIAVEDQKPLVQILVGSRSDLDQIKNGLTHLRGKANFAVSVMSCHRNPDELRNFARDVLFKADVVIAGAGMAAALPGIVKSHLCYFGHSEIPVIGVAFDNGKTDDNIAAAGSIESLPGQPVELDHQGKAYFGPLGFTRACWAALDDEFLPKEIVAKPAEIGIIDYREE